MDKEYDYELAFSYNCIMSVLKKEYPKLKIDKLEASVWLSKINQTKAKMGLLRVLRAGKRNKGQNARCSCGGSPCPCWDH